MRSPFPGADREGHLAQQGVWQVLQLQLGRCLISHRAGKQRSLPAALRGISSASRRRNILSGGEARRAARNISMLSVPEGRSRGTRMGRQGGAKAPFLARF